jgi:hypothetical protein
VSPVLDPERPTDDAFLDAVLGLDRLCRALAVLDDAIPSSDDALRGSPDLPDDLPDDVLDVLLGAISIRTTVALVLAAAASANPRSAPVADAAWSRELLR